MRNSRKLVFILVPIVIVITLLYSILSPKGALADQSQVAERRSEDSYFPFSIEGGSEEFGELKIIASNDLAPGDHFGRTTIISGTLLIISSIDDDDNGNDSGAVYIFEKDSGGANNWGQVKKITPSDGSAGDGFGLGLALDGDTLAVGAYLDDANGSNSGSVYIFERDLGGPDNWGERIRIAPSDGAASDRFGWDVGISGGTLIVGAMFDDTACSGMSCNSGSAYVFERNADGDNNWGLIKKLVPADLATKDLFGHSVQISGNTVLITAGIYGDIASDRLGRIYVFERDEGGGNNWGETTVIFASDGFQNNNFGFSISIFEDTLLVGARNDDEAGTASGAVYVFERNAGGRDNWGETAKLVAPDTQPGDHLGRHVSLRQDTFVATADLGDHPLLDSGYVVVFSRQSEGLDFWVYESTLAGSGVGSNEISGAWASVSGDSFVLGGHNGNFAGNESGEAYLFQRGEAPPATPTATATSHVRPTSTPFPSGTPGPTQTPGGGRPTHTPAPPTSTPGSGGQVHVGDLDGSSTPNGDTRWDAMVEITVLDQNGVPVANTTVSGAWGGGVTGAGSCLTDGSGKCTIMRLLIRNATPSVIFTVTDLSAGGFAYDPGANTDPDGDSNGTVIVVNKP